MDNDAEKVLLRTVRCLSGWIDFLLECEPAFDYGRRHGVWRYTAEGYGHAEVSAGDDEPAIQLTTDLNLGFEGPRAIARRRLRAGDQVFCALSWGDASPPENFTVAQQRLSRTGDFWHDWISRGNFPDHPWRGYLQRSALTLKGLIYSRTGALLAAATTSLPETLGGERNYDYRFAWVRDLCFTLDALLSVGMDELTQTSVEWLLQATNNSHPRVDPVYALDGSVVRSQQSLPLAGYRRTAPVHLGNNAGAQLQLGGFGDLLETICLYVSHGHLLGPAAGERLADIVDLLVHIWRGEDSGLWELGDTAHYGTSKLGVWVAFDRLLDLVDRAQAPPRHTDGWRRARDQVREFIDAHLFSEERNAYLFKAGSTELDCGLLLAARRGYGPESRINGTIDAIRAELHADGPLFYRYSGMQDEENAFLACSFWMVEALAITGRLDEAAEMMDELIGLASDVGLYSEEMEPGTHAMRGNFPQALTHLSLINAADAIASRADSRRPGAPAREHQVV
jgi:GH15 family glucan-1,4-alpha-glucosidase